MADARRRLRAWRGLVFSPLVVPGVITALVIPHHHARHARARARAAALRARAARGRRGRHARLSPRRHFRGAPRARNANFIVSACGEARAKRAALARNIIRRSPETPRQARATRAVAFTPRQRVRVRGAHNGVKKKEKHKTHDIVLLLLRAGAAPLLRARGRCRRFECPAERGAARGAGGACAGNSKKPVINDADRFVQMHLETRRGEGGGMPRHHFSLPITIFASSL